MEERHESRSGSQAIERAMAVLDCFAGGTQLTLGKIAVRTGLPVSTTHRILQALVRGRFLARVSGDCYKVGPRVAELLPRSSMADEVAPHLYLLAAALKITVSFAVLEERELATLVRARPPVKYDAAQIPLDREPLHATALGKVLLAFEPENPGTVARSLGNLSSYTPHTHTSPADLAADLDRIRRSGFALANEERTLGVRAVAVPVFCSDRRPVGALGIQDRSTRLTDDFVRSVVPVMRHLAKEVSQRLDDAPLVSSWPDRSADLSTM